MAILLFVGSSTVLARQTQSVPTNITDNQLVSVRLGDLPADIRAQIIAKSQLEDTKQKIEQYGQWVGIGKEVGVAINDGLEAVTEKAEKFANTTPGKVTIFVIIWKVIGRELAGLFVGVPLIGLTTWIFFYAWRTLFRGRIVRTVNAEGKRVEQFVEATVKSFSEGERIGAALALPVLYFIVIGIFTGTVIF